MTPKKTILLVDDDVPLREALAEQLALEGEFQTLEAGTGADGLKIAAEGGVDLILLDVGLPDLDGRLVCRKMREAQVRCPIIMLTGAAGDSDTVEGLESGANDYVTKPFRFAVLMARLRAHLRNFETSEDAVFQIGPYTFRPSAKILVDSNKKKIRLTEKETSILKFLYRTGAKVVNRDTLLAEVWGYNANVTTHTLETHIYRLRQKIETNPTEARLLITEPGGYRLVP